MRNYKFSITLENSSIPGYTTGKIFHAFVSRTIPIYWGNPDVVKDFNPNAFINAHSFKSTNDVIDYIKRIDSDDEMYLKIINSSVFNDKIPDYLHETYIESFFSHIFSQELQLARRLTYYGYMGAYYANLKKLVIESDSYKKATSGLKGAMVFTVGQFKKRFFLDFKN
jgi:hypothetical protein